MVVVSSGSSGGGVRAESGKHDDPTEEPDSDGGAEGGFLTLSLSAADKLV